MYSSTFLIIFKDPLQWLHAWDVSFSFFFFCLGGVGQGEVGKKPSMSLILSNEFAVLDTTSKDASLPIAASSHMGSEHQSGLWWQHGLWKSF